MALRPFGGSSTGRAPDSESGGWRFDPSPPSRHSDLSGELWNIVLAAVEVPPSRGRHHGSLRAAAHRVPSSSGLGHHPLKVGTRVRTPLGLLCVLPGQGCDGGFDLYPLGQLLPSSVRLRFGGHQRDDRWSLCGGRHIVQRTRQRPVSIQGGVLVSLHRRPDGPVTSFPCSQLDGTAEM